MNKEVKYNGYSAVPSDYEAPDGDLAVAINLIPENGGLHPLFPPAVAVKAKQGMTPVFVHKTSGKNENILYQKSDKLFYNDVEIYSSGKPLAIEAIGNTVVVASDTAMCYLLWRDDSYINLGSRPPRISIDFGLSKTGTLTDATTFKDIPSEFLNTSSGASMVAARGNDSASDRSRITQMIYAQLLSQVAEKVISNGCFYQPFFIRYAYRFYDGSYAYHSAPILMLPSVNPPAIKVSSIDTEKKTLVSSLDVPYFRLQHRLLTDGLDELKKWNDLIVAIDVFISAPIYTYDQSKDLPVNIFISENSFYARNALPANAGLRASDRSRPSRAETSKRYFIGHYNDDLTTQRYIDHYYDATNPAGQLWNIAFHEHFLDNIKNTHTFYKVAEIATEDISPTDSDKLVALELTNSDFSELVTLPILPDDYRSQCALIPGDLYTYNSRLNLADLRMQPAEPFPLRSAAAFSNPDDGISAIGAEITVWLKIDGQKCIARHVGYAQADRVYNSKSEFPRYLFYPDASAYKMQIKYSDSDIITIPLKPHDFLNGAYYFGSFLADSVPESQENIEADELNLPQTVPIKSKIYTSEVNNPFVFPLTGINTIGSGEVRRICSAAKALSQGQFGQFPLYAFTTEGVWALEVSSTGTYSARQPITRDVCINADGITQLDNAVLFPSDRGIMLISGSQTQCISEAINSDYPFDALSLPGFGKLHDMLEHNPTNDKCLPTLQFTEFLKQCRMIYDYVHQRVIVYAPGITYAYVFSLKSQMWGMTFSNIASHLNSYPEALAVDEDNNIVNFSESDGTDAMCLSVTRPLKLDSANIHKTIDNIIQRGKFAKGHVHSALYGSSDLINWHLVWSSKDHFLRGFSGSPFKYFRVALLCRLSPDESIYGASVQFSPRLTNHPR